MNDYEKEMNNYKKETTSRPKRIATQPIPIPKESTANSSMVHIELSPSSHLWLLGNNENLVPAKRSPGNSLR